jgi:type III pantothenate kinase
MYLTIDIGNTSIKYALWQPAGGIAMRGIGIDSLTRDCADKGITHCIIATVADSSPVTSVLAYLGIAYQILDSHTALPIAIDYHSPDTLGADRIAAAVAAHALAFSQSMLVITAGTCITYTLVQRGRLIGGGICPGIKMRFKALHDYTHALPLIDWQLDDDSTDTLVGLTTSASIRSGVLLGVLHEVQGTIDDYMTRYDGLSCYMTGGDMPFLVKHLKNNIFARPDMVLEGLYHILHYHV